MSATPGTDTVRALGLLEGAGLIALAATEPELEYLFRHVLIQDAAYESLLRQERRELHARVADALLALYPEHRHDLAPVLAHHLERADDRPRAIEFLALAARRARERFARHEAVDLATRAVTLLPADDAITPDERRLRAELRLLAAEAGSDFVPLSDSIALLETAIADAEALGDTAIAARGHLEIALGHSVSGAQYRTSPELAASLDAAQRLADASGDPALIAMSLAITGEARYSAAEYRAAIDLMERGIPLLVDAGLLYQASMSAGKLGTAYGRVGDFDRAVAWTDRAFALGEESGDPNASLDADLARSIVESLRGDSATAIEYATRAAAEADRVDNKACLMVARSVIGEERLRLGDPIRAAQAFEASAELAAFCQFMPVKVEQTELMLQAARARAGVGHVEFERYERALELARHVGDRLAEGELYRQRAEDRLHAGQREAARDDLGRSAAIFAEIGAESNLRQAHELEAAVASRA